MRTVRLCSWAFVLGLALAAPLDAQDFAAPEPLVAEGGVATLLERGLPPPSMGSVAVEAVAIRWHALPDLTTRSLAAGVAFHSARLAIGVAQTGWPDVGWTALAVGAGVATSGARAALRAVARRDRTSEFGFDDHGARVGVEVGGGAALEVAPGLFVWASAPQLWVDGSAPPLARGLELGGAADRGPAALSLARIATRDGGEHVGTLALVLEPLRLWVEGRDRPARGGFGLALDAGPLRLSVAIDSHPVLGETARVGLAMRAGAGP